jgi:hypothetical protein
MYCLVLTPLLGISAGQATPASNLDFHKGTLEGWEGQGFVLTGGTGEPYAVSSADQGSPSRKGMIRYVLTIPAGIAKISFHAYAAVPDGASPDHRLDVLLAGAGNRLAPRQVRTPAGWRPAPQLLPRWQGKPREYAWDVTSLSGQRYQIVIVDQDDRPGFHVVCSGFHFEPVAQPQDDEFAQYMLELQKKHKLAPMARYDSKRFTAYSNASESFTALRLKQCEVFYDLFYNHFLTKGFAMHHPSQHLMLAVFDSPDGVDAYLGTQLPSGITGMYHPVTNRLLLYDQSENRFIQEQKKKALDGAKKIASSTDRTRIVETIERKMDIFAKDIDLTTTMHEAAHQLSFNCGLLNRQGDVAPWLAEGLACYCEATETGEWQAIGAPNSARTRDLARARGKFIPLEVMVKNDWRSGNVLLGYGQSWALFRMLIQDRPQAMKAYLAQIYTRRTVDYRLADFRQFFGNDLAALELRYFAYMREIVEKHK